MNRTLAVWLTLLAGSSCLSAAEAPALPGAKPVPRMQAVPLPHDQVSFERDGVEIARYHFGPDLRRPFVFPILGPLGRPLTRMGHPHDPITHSHHNSVWISHADVDGVPFWPDQKAGQITVDRIEELGDGAEAAFLITQGTWRRPEGGGALLRERRRVLAKLLPEKEWLLAIDLQLFADGKAVTLGKTPFGMIGVRMAKTIGVTDGGGTIRNSEGGVDESGVFWKRARWVDYSGPIATGVAEGVTLLDHPSNPNHPTVFHVRDDGWMGASLTFDGPRVVEPGKPLRLCYGLYVHGGLPSREALEGRWKEFSTFTPLAEPEAKR